MKDKRAASGMNGMAPQRPPAGGKLLNKLIHFILPLREMKWRVLLMEGAALFFIELLGYGR